MPTLVHSRKSQPPAHSGNAGGPVAGVLLLLGIIAVMTVLLLIRKSDAPPSKKGGNPPTQTAHTPTPRTERSPYSLPPSGNTSVSSPYHPLNPSVPPSSPPQSPPLQTPPSQTAGYQPPPSLPPDPAPRAPVRMEGHAHIGDAKLSFENDGNGHEQAIGRVLIV